MQINNNIPALRARNALTRSNTVTDKHMRNLSTGLRVNTAADDAAGMAISNKMKTQVRGLKRASMNSQDGISLVQTAEGALNEVQSMLQRMRELAVQGANGTLTSEDRRAIQMEVDQLKQEITSTANLTEFNKLKLLDGQMDRRSFTDNNKIAESAYVSDTVLPGQYDFEVVAIGTKALKTMENSGMSINANTGITDTQVGRININGEEIKITKGMSSDQVFASMRDLAETVGLNLTKDDTGRLTLTSFEAGSSQKITVFSDNAELLKVVGLDLITEDNAIKGSDAIVNLDPASSFGNTATVTANGNRVEITDSNYKKIYIDLSVTKNSTGLKTSGSSIITEANIFSGTSSGFVPATVNSGTILSGMTGSGVLAAYGKAPDPIKIGGMEFISSNGASLNGYTIRFVTDSGATAAAATVNSGSKVITITGSGGDLSGLTAAATATLVNTQLAAASGLQRPAMTLTPISGGSGATFDKTDNLSAKFQNGANIDPIKAGTLLEKDNKNSTLSVLDAGPMQLQVGANEGMTVHIQIPTLTSTALGLDYINMRTVEGAGHAITLCDYAIAEISAVRSKLGAYQNRLEYTINNLDVTSENTTAALSRIEDADMAYEMAQYTQKSTITQAGVSMLAKANQRPQQVLQLLQS